MSELHRHSLKSAIAQIEKCSFECEAGPLVNSVVWQWLSAAAKVGPEFMPGQGVWFEIEAVGGGKTLRQWVHFYVVGCAMTSDTERRLWTYSLSYDPPAPWHYGTTHFTNIAANKLRIEKPETVNV